MTDEELKNYDKNEPNTIWSIGQHRSVSQDESKRTKFEMKDFEELKAKLSQLKVICHLNEFLTNPRNMLNQLLMRCEPNFSEDLMTT